MAYPQSADNVLFTEEEIEEIFGSDADTKKDELDELKGNEATGSQPEGDEKANSPTAPVKKEDTVTQIVAKRLREETPKVRDQVAQEAGYKDYADMMASKEKRKYEEKGYDPEDAKKLVDEVVEERLKADPRIAKLEQYEQAEKNKFLALQVEELNKSVGTKFKTLQEVPAEVVDLWSNMKKPNLKQAYYAIKGEEIAQNKAISRVKEVEANGTEHLKSNAGGMSAGSANLRPVNRDEIEIIRAFNPNITDEEIKKRLTK